MVPIVDGVGEHDALSIGLSQGLELRGLVGTTGYRAGPLTQTSLAITRRERFGLKYLKVIT